MNVFEKQQQEFITRHIGPGDREISEMLEVLGLESVEQLIALTVPEGIRLRKSPALPPGMSEHQYLEELRQTAARNKVFKNYIGQGYYETITPSVILRTVFENPGWYTQYTPYQAEIAQGRLESLLNFQTLVGDLTALPVANASLLDEATAAAEAMTMLFNARNKDEGAATCVKFFVDEHIFSQTKDVLYTRAVPVGIELVEGNALDAELDDTFFAAIVQYPDSNGHVQDFRSFISRAREKQVRVVMATDLLALTLLTPPGELGADVAVGNCQRLGVPMGYGGPHAAFFATREEFKRIIPGRIIGVSIDARGERCLRMALQTREQHIRREKATSNICTAQALLSNMTAMFAVYHGPDGLKSIATRISLLALTLYNELRRLGFEPAHAHFFDTIKVPVADAEAIRKDAESRHINFFYFEDGSVGISLGETTGRRDIEEIIQLFARSRNVPFSDAVFDQVTTLTQIPTSLTRTSAFLQHPVFNNYHSESKMMRYIKQLENKDLSLNTSMISLGSCTMKLNAATELIPVSWPEFSQIHPFAPEDQVKGYAQIIYELEKYLAEITGFAATSLQPNSGAQGEYAGLMAIRRYHESRGEAHRNVVLIPVSAHGTNPASAVMAGMRVVVTRCDEKGNIDMEELRTKALEHAGQLAALMVTYPSTHGVFEEGIREICQIIHDQGGQVYMDGANMNAQVGITSPGMIGADVCHLNLHKTFAIPHGGGGPGVGPICVAAHLAPFLPGHLHTAEESGFTHAVSAAPFGSASILLISYGYIKMLGGRGVKRATEIAILNANYMKKRLESFYPILYTGKNGTAAHEFIVDLRPFKASAGIEAEDVAKRLMDYGFHAPTLSFPVAGTLMIEPTESEDKAELDRFCDALIGIFHEIKAIEQGQADRKDNVLKHAPHTQAVVTADSWDRPYSREKAAFPLSFVRNNKFWPSVSRVNNTHGDRNLICTCAPVEQYMEQPVQ
jgi:glycine dehydrogenase